MRKIVQAHKDIIGCSKKIARNNKKDCSTELVANIYAFVMLSAFSWQVSITS